MLGVILLLLKHVLKVGKSCDFHFLTVLPPESIMLTAGQDPTTEVG